MADKKKKKKIKEKKKKKFDIEETILGLDKKIKDIVKKTEDSINY